ncbi:hypothetical protein COHA_009210 [Chlorella ohadii]|uniref:Uncharacterized protein n=1 Tax=Chlorella ohadii TaxID=2649997 RepID=A0AAD5GY35_9CHLO|nr:hypothetical protein COHA_009210 [Chlorella ohadii]
MSHPPDIKHRARQAAAQLAATQAALEALSVEHEALQAARRHEGREAAEVAAHHRQLMADKDAQLAAAQAAAAAAEARLDEENAAAEQREAALAAAAAAEAALLQQAAAGLQAKLDGLAEFVAQREGLLAELQRMRAEKAAAAEQAADKIRALQRRVHEAEQRANASSGAAADEPDGGDASDEIYAEGEVHRLLAHSRRAAAEMEQYGKEAEALQSEMRALERERAGLLRDVALQQEMEAQYAKRGTLQAKEIRSARTKITSLEKGLVRMAADFEQASRSGVLGGWEWSWRYGAGCKQSVRSNTDCSFSPPMHMCCLYLQEKGALEQQLRAQLADAVAEQNSLRRLLQVRTRELRQVRRLAQQVLLQRSEVEAFLVSSIQLPVGRPSAEAAPLPPLRGLATEAGPAGLA